MLRHCTSSCVAHTIIIDFLKLFSRRERFRVYFERLDAPLIPKCIPDHYNYNVCRHIMMLLQNKM